MKKIFPFAVLLLAACSAEAPLEPSSSAPPSNIDGEPLSLSQSDETRIAGSYIRNGVQLDFDVRRIAATRRSLVLSAVNGEELLRVEHDGDRFASSAFGGRAKVIVDLAVMRESARLEQLPEDQRPPFSTAGGFRQEGDQKAFDELERRPEYAALPWLSRALGAKGFDGASHPVALLLHHGAMQAAAQLGVEVPPLDRPSPATGAPAGGSNIGGSNLGGPRVDGLPVTGSHVAGLECVDLRSDPYNDDSLGMCGPGTTCWQWVCGDCCCHAGCRSHDKTCRRCTWYRPWNCILCATGASFMNGQCDECGGTEFYDPPCASVGSPCNEATCCQTHDGSTEAEAAPQQVTCDCPGGICYVDVPPECSYE